jgi:hypothetical protein
MKLNPPASSSDLELARQIARRLHQHRRRDDQPEPGWPSEDAPIRPRLEPPPLPRRPAALDADEAPAPRAPAPPRPLPSPRPESAQPPEPQALREASVYRQPPPARAPVHRPEPEPEAPAVFTRAVAPPFERRVWEEAEAVEPEPEPLAELTGPPEARAFAPEEPELDTAPALPDVDVDVIDEPSLSPEEMVGEADAEGSPLDALTDPEPDGSLLDEALLGAAPAAEEPAAPSWDEIVESCRGLAQARGAMLIDPAGQVFASCGDWPAPGPDAIAGKLVAMMAKMLKDAPTRSISAPLMGMQLTAWRVPVDEGLLTVAFIGAAAVRADARPTIDAEIQRGMPGLRS